MNDLEVKSETIAGKDDFVPYGKVTVKYKGTEVIEIKVNIEKLQDLRNLDMMAFYELKNYISSLIQ